MSERERLLKNIMEYDFALNELVLFLDTHLRNKKALDLHRTLAAKSRELKARFEADYGPITSSGVYNASESWTWATEPWPWDN
jgi:spore coat protein JB